MVPGGVAEQPVEVEHLGGDLHGHRDVVDDPEGVGLGDGPPLGDQQQVLRLGLGDRRPGAQTAAELLTAKAMATSWADRRRTWLEAWAAWAWCQRSSVRPSPSRAAASRDGLLEPGGGRARQGAASGVQLLADRLPALGGGGLGEVARPPAGDDRGEAGAPLAHPVGGDVARGGLVADEQALQPEQGGDEHRLAGAELAEHAELVGTPGGVEQPARLVARAGDGRSPARRADRGAPAGAGSRRRTPPPCGCPVSCARPSRGPSWGGYVHLQRSHGPSASGTSPEKGPRTPCCPGGLDPSYSVDVP